MLYGWFRDILPVTLRLPKVITMAKKEERLVVSAMAKGINLYIEHPDIFKCAW